MREHVSTGELSVYLGVAPASVTEMLEKLSEEGYVVHTPYRGAILTPEGFREAQRVTRKHRLLERFLSDVLHIPMERVHSQACEMEHSLSDEAEESLCRLLRHPDRCPDDRQIIPACDLPFQDCGACLKAVKSDRTRGENLRPISSLEVGEEGIVAFIRRDRGALLRLRNMGLTAGVMVTAGRIRPGGTLEISVGGSKKSLRTDIADGIFVTVGKEGPG